MLAGQSGALIVALITFKNKFNIFRQIRQLLSLYQKTENDLESTLDDKFFFSSTLSLESPNGQVENINKDNVTGHFHFSVYHFGLTGAMGVLPLVYTEWLIERESRYNDRSAKAYLDIFNHRMYCLAYMAWHKIHCSSQLYLDEDHIISDVILSLCGMQQTPYCFPGLQHARFYAGPVRSLSGLEQMLKQSYQIPIQVEPFYGCWEEISHPEKCILGKNILPLGSGPVIGSFRWDINSGFKVIIGPTDVMSAKKFMAGGVYHQSVKEQIKLYVGIALNFYLEIKIDSSSMPWIPLGECTLGTDATAGKGRRKKIQIQYIN